ncbi:MAG: hypothetical protein IPN58_00935 [Anaerolineales bacterium]|nr:hypothetical protein [Anaerolineales bacterium]
METNQSEIFNEMHRLIEAANAKNIQLRAIGGLAVQAHNQNNHPLFVRDFGDLDFVSHPNSARNLKPSCPKSVISRTRNSTS